ncbi:hypothetical protein [Sodalis sp.]|uniref:hypothetical protein n=1 Tax=Sodalis sp. (in: enterobacteria) TaxID=1898979 RepID=UPI0038731F08
MMLFDIFSVVSGLTNGHVATTSPIRWRFTPFSLAQSLVDWSSLFDYLLMPLTSR